ncbi:DUF3105 domain-containing protein [Pseudonocardia sp. MH-G8]|uniref:DUF3105 domain-containing protein n=1 Tax=Pseudonocardia sp. MH-G8 TaxID=1854588 RepID=UPI000BA0F870|nr:DUF3105 domain-containing protein [Pseudonocardia sp. MH-G8]OZM76396.1 hypothetical protein CFP66_41425 [Pseudonocardia sp. MH-G8]
MVSGKKSKQARQPRSALATGREVPWGTIAAVLVVVLFAGGVFGYAFLQSQENNARDAALAAFVPSASNQDPSSRIPGITEQTYQGAQHVAPTEQVAYTGSPPTGGTHDQYWAACSGVVYEQPVRSENLVHSMEHGAVWIAYNPDQVDGDALAQLAARVQDRPYSVLSPYPGLDQPIALQSWGHQLKLADAGDPRIDQFLTALRANQYTHPEVGASCQALGPGQFDQDDPPPYRPAPPPSSVGQPGVRGETEASPAAPGMDGSSPGGGS